MEQPDLAYPVVHSGYLWKSGAYLWSRWRRRWCVLRGQTLFYYTAPQTTQAGGGELKGSITINPGIRIDLDVPQLANTSGSGASASHESVGYVGIQTSTTRARSGSRFGRRPSLINLKRGRPTLRLHSKGRDHHFEAVSWDDPDAVMEDAEEATHILKQWCQFLRRASTGEFSTRGEHDINGESYVMSAAGTDEDRRNIFRSLEQLAESEATKAVARQLRGLDSLDAIPQLCEKSHNELKAVERKIRRAVRGQVINLKQVIDAVHLINYEFHELESNVHHTRDLCVRQHRNLVNSSMPINLISDDDWLATKRGNQSHQGRGPRNNTIHARRTGDVASVSANATNNMNTVSIIQRVAFAKNNLRRTLTELDMYRRVPLTVSELCSALDRDPVQHLPRAHFEYRKLVSWFDGPYHEWNYARREYLLKLLGRGSDPKKTDGRGHNHVIARGVRLLAEDESQRERVDGVVDELHKQVYRLGDAWQAALWEVLGPRVFELAQSRPGGVVLAAQIVETAHRQNQSKYTACDGSLSLFSHNMVFICEF